MCLEYIFTKKELKRWLAEQPDPVTVYKVVRVEGDGKWTPAYARHFSFRKTKRNTVDITNKKPIYVKFLPGKASGKYMPAFHFCITKAAAFSWIGYSSHRVERCLVRKQDILHIGKQDGDRMLIATSFVFADSFKGEE